MKKKVVALIVLSSVGLVLGGLIYLGISSAPEILESTKTIKAEEAYEAPTINEETIVVEEDHLFEQQIVVNESGVSGSADYTPSLFDDSEVVYIDAPNESISFIFSSDSISDYFDEPIVLEFYPTFADESKQDDFVATPIDEPAVENVEENVVIEDHALYTSSFEEKDDVPLKITKAPKKRASKNQTVRSNQAVVETSLIVVGAVDLLSIILIKRRKHLFR